MAENKRRGWTLVLLPDDQSTPREFRIPRRVVLTLIIVLVLIITYAVVETVLFWVVANRAAEVEPLRARVKELESSNSELQRMGAELTKLRVFEKQLRSMLQGQESAGHVPPAAKNESQDDSEPPSFAGPLSLEPTGAANRLFSSLAADVHGLSGHSISATDLPTVPPVRGYLTRNFVLFKPYREVAHYGLDIAAREGTPVLAAADGLVVFSDWTYLYGSLVILAHRSGYITFYGHNQVLFAQPGSWVRQGEPVALLGNSGVSSAPHLHFEVWKEGSPVDPRTLLQASP